MNNVSYQTALLLCIQSMRFSPIRFNCTSFDFFFFYFSLAFAQSFPFPFPFFCFFHLLPSQPRCYLLPKFIQQLHFQQNDNQLLAQVNLLVSNSFSKHSSNTNSVPELFIKLSISSYRLLFTLSKNSKILLFPVSLSILIYFFSLIIQIHAYFLFSNCYASVLKL